MPIILKILERARVSFDDFVNHVYESNGEQTPPEIIPNLEEVNRKMKRAILYLISRKEYYGSLIPHLNIYGSTSPKYKTMCTDGSSIMFHPEFVMNQTEEALRMVLAHEIMHCVGEHMSRRGNRNPELWNIATDYSINPLLNDEPGFEWPKDEKGEKMGLYDSKFEGMRAEDIYDELKSKYPSGPPPQLIKKGEMGEVIDDDEELPTPSPGMEIQRSIDAPEGEDEDSGAGDQEGQEGLPKQDSEKPGSGPQKQSETGEKEKDGETEGGKKSQPLPAVGQRVRLADGTEAVIKKVYPNGDIEI